MTTKDTNHTNKEERKNLLPYVFVVVGLPTSVGSKDQIIAAYRGDIRVIRVIRVIRGHKKSHRQIARGFRCLSRVVQAETYMSIS
ncbi:MAG: hypothetical protein WD045_04800 [Pirellulaceae bacterium]